MGSQFIHRELKYDLLKYWKYRGKLQSNFEIDKFSEEIFFIIRQMLNESSGFHFSPLNSE